MERLTAVDYAATVGDRVCGDVPRVQWSLDEWIDNATDAVACGADVSISHIYVYTLHYYTTLILEYYNIILLQ